VRPNSSLAWSKRFGFNGNREHSCSQILLVSVALIKTMYGVFLSKFDTHGPFLQTTS